MFKIHYSTQKLCRVGLLSALLLTSGCLFKTNMSSQNMLSSGKAPDTYCYCPSKNGTLGVTHFQYEKSDLVPEAAKLINAHIADCVVKRFMKDSKLKIMVTGHADKRGTHEYNLALGARRAASVKEALFQAVQTGLASATAKPKQEEVMEETNPQSPFIGEEPTTATLPIAEDYDPSEDLASRFCINSKGKTELVDDNENEFAHAKNRRAVIEFVEDCQ